MTGRYEIVSEIGRSATGVVYLAADRLTGDRVALRIITAPVIDSRPPVEGREAASRGGEPESSRLLGLSQQLRLIALLHHPNLASLLGYGFDSEMRPYYTQRFLEQPRELLAAGRGQPFETRADYVLQILQGLTYLHRSGVVHGDLRSRTALVDGTRVRLVNYGLPALHEAESKDDAYLAPEVRRGEPGSAAADLFAVGVLVYRLFSDQDDGFVNEHQISTREIDVRLIPMLGKLLAEDPGQRYLDATQAMRDFCGALSQPLPEETKSIRQSFLETGTLVGRRREMARLTSLLEAALQGRGSALRVIGESGVGKSRLAAELRSASLAAGALVLRGWGTVEGYSPFYSWRRIRRHLCLVVDVDDESAVALNAHVPDVEELIGRVVAEPAVLDPQAAQRRFQVAVKSLFSRLAQPVVVILEDFHWAGSESLVLLEELRQDAHRLALLLVATYSDDERPDLSFQLSEMPSLKLERFTQQAVGELAESILGPHGRQPEVIDLLRRETGGNAYFLVEVVRALAEEAGRLDRIDPARLPREITTGGVREIVERRLERLPRKVRPLLRLAAVAGRGVDLELLETLEPGLQPGLWLRFCSEQAVLEMDGGHWRFASDRFRQVLIDGLPPAELRSAHRQVAEAIAATHGTKAPQVPKLAYHWTRAADPGDPGATALAVHYLQRAGHQALLTCAHREAVDLLTRGLDLLATLPPAAARARQEIRYQIDLGAALFIGRGLTAPEVGQAFSRARSLSEGAGDASQQITALTGLWRFHIVRAELETARQLAEATLHQARSRRRAAHRVLAEYVLGTTILFQGDCESGVRHLQQAIDRFLALEAGPRREMAAKAFYLGEGPGVAALGYAAWATWCLGYPDHARNLDRRALALADELEHPFSQAFARLASAWLHQMRDDPRATEAAAGSAIELSQEQGFPDFLAFATMFRAWARARQGRTAGAADDIRGVLDKLRSTEVELFRPHYLGLLAEVHGEASQPEDALGLLEEAIENADRAGSGFWKPELVRLAGELCLELPRPNRRRAESYFERARARARERRERSLELRALLSLARLRRGDAERLAPTLEALGELYASFSEGLDTPDLIAARRLL